MGRREELRPLASIPDQTEAPGNGTSAHTAADTQLVGLFADYQEDAWPTLAQVRNLPPSRTGLGLDQPLAVILAATTDMDREALREVMSRFCRTWPGDGGHVCGCAAMDVERVPPEQPDQRRVDAHVTAESVAVERLFAAWTLQHHGPEMPFNGVPVGQYMARFSEYDL